MTQRHSKTAVVLTAALTLSAATAWAGEWVTGYVGSTVRTYTAEGEPSGEVPVTKLPPKGGEVKGHDKKNHPGIEISKDQIIYVKASDVFITDSNAPVCQDLALAGKKAGSQLAATAGVRHGAAATAVPCVK